MKTLKVYNHPVDKYCSAAFQRLALYKSATIMGGTINNWIATAFCVKRFKIFWLRKTKRIKKFTYLTHVKKHLHGLLIADMDTFNTHVDFKHRAFIFASSLVKVAMALLKTEYIERRPQWECKLLILIKND